MAATLGRLLQLNGEKSVSGIFNVVLSYLTFIIPAAILVPTNDFLSNFYETVEKSNECREIWVVKRECGNEALSSPSLTLQSLQ